jgi:Protein of unknown function (DUF2786)
MSERAKILHRIRALMSKTVDNGCTEAEALAALNLARSMMDEYEVTEEDIKLKGENADIYASTARDPYHIRRGLSVRISQFCDCKVWTTIKAEITFCGLRSDIEFASWLLDTLSEFAVNEMVKYLPWKQPSPSEKRKLINGFVLGFCGRINHRLNEIIEASRLKAGLNNKALVVAKGELINKRMQEEGVLLRTPRRRGRYFNNDSYSAGKNAADKASFGRPISGQGAVRRIGN